MEHCTLAEFTSFPYTGPEIAWDSGKKGQLAQWDGLRQSDVLEQLTSQDRLGGGSVSMLLYMPIATLDP